MKETENVPVEIGIIKKSNYQGKPVLDYIITTMKELNNEIQEIHNDISYKNTNITIEEKIKDKDEKIIEEFNNIFKNNENNLSLFEYINNINKNHIKKYLAILDFLNLNIVYEKNKENKKEQNQNKINNESNIIQNSSIIIHDIKIEEKIEEGNQVIGNQNKKESSNIIEKSKSIQDDLDLNENKYNNNFEYEIKEIKENKEKNEIKEDKINENNSNSIIDYKDTVNYSNMNNNNQIIIKENKFNLEKEETTYENDIDNEDNEIIINENDDSICHLDQDETKDNINQNNILNDSFSNNELKKSNDIKKCNEIINEKLENPILNDNDEQKGEDLNIDINNEINLEKENAYGKKDRINIKNVERRLFRKDNSNNNNNITFIDIKDRKDICTCFVF